jgi:hypothetical protein
MIKSSGECSGWPVSHQGPLDATEELVAFKDYRYLTDDMAAHRWRLECSLTSLSEHHISQIRRRVSALIDRHSRYVTAVTAVSVYSRCLCAVRASRWYVMWSCFASLIETRAQTGAAYHDW